MLVRGLIVSRGAVIRAVSPFLCHCEIRATHTPRYAKNGLESDIVNTKMAKRMFSWIWILPRIIDVYLHNKNYIKWTNSTFRINYKFSSSLKKIHLFHFDVELARKNCKCIVILWSLIRNHTSSRHGTTHAPHTSNVLRLMMPLYPWRLNNNRHCYNIVSRITFFGRQFMLDEAANITVWICPNLRHLGFHCCNKSLIEPKSWGFYVGILLPVKSKVIVNNI